MASKKSSDQETASSQSVEVSQAASPDEIPTASTGPVAAPAAAAPDKFGITFHGNTPPPGFVERNDEFVPFKTAEAWAEAKGMLPEFIPLPQPFARADAPVVMQHNAQSWRYAATRAGSGWPIGKELTEAEFDAAVMTATTGHQYR